MKIIYWLSTSIISIFLLLSSFTYIFSKETIEGIKALGFPNFFRIELAILKLFAVFILMLPIVPVQMKEWGYAGVGLFLITAFVAHLKHKDSILIMILLVVLFGILIVSNVSMNKLMK